MAFALARTCSALQERNSFPNCVELPQEVCAAYLLSAAMESVVSVAATWCDLGAKTKIGTELQHLSADCDAAAAYLAPHSEDQVHRCGAPDESGNGVKDVGFTRVLTGLPRHRPS